MSTASLQVPPFMHWFGIDSALIERVLAAAMSRGAEFADLYFQHLKSISLSLEDGIVSRANTSVDRGVGVRAVVGDQVGYAYSESLELDSMLAAAHVAATIADAAVQAAPQQLMSLALPDRYPLAQAWETVEVEERIPLLRRTEAAVRAMETAVEKVSVYWADSDERVLIATSDGTLAVDRRPMATLGCQLTALKNGVRQSHGANFSRRVGLEVFGESRLQAICREAGGRTLILFEARRPPAGQLPVVLAAGASGILLHEAIGHGLEADFNRKGISIYSTLLGQRVAPDFVTLIDDGSLLHDRGALNVDDEGTQVERTTLIEGGMLRGYLHDRISARHYGVSPTGSGRRQSFRHAPMPRMRSTYMLNGPHTRDEIIAAVDRGIIAETFTNGQVQIGAGDFTFYIKNGWLIEGGRITAPIKDANIIGNGPEALRHLQMAAADMKIDSGSWTCGKNGQGAPVSQGIPTVLVKSLTVGGVND